MNQSSCIAKETPFCSNQNSRLQIVLVIDQTLTIIVQALQHSIAKTESKQWNLCVQFNCDQHYHFERVGYRNTLNTCGSDDNVSVVSNKVRVHGTSARLIAKEQIENALYFDGIVNEILAKCQTSAKDASGACGTIGNNQAEDIPQNKYLKG